MVSHTLPTLHLYRHLLREATYLPRPCRSYVHEQITTRFKKHMKDDSEHHLTKYRLREAHSQLRSLHAANAGVLAHMKRILYLTTGQLGARRRKLMAETFLIDKNSTDKEARAPARLPPIEALDYRGRPLQRDWLDNWDLPKLTAMAASQARHEFPSGSRREIKGNRVEPTRGDIPAENALGRPLGIRAARRHMRKWYKSLIDKVLPPLPREEWEALGRIARGEDEPWKNGQPARRKLCGDATKKAGWDWKSYAVEPVRSIERGQSRSMKARTGEQGQAPYGLGEAIGVHRYDNMRMLRRLYMRVWQSSPTMEAVGNGKQWKIEWGKDETEEVPLAMPAQMDFFGGAPEQGSGRDGKSGKGRKSGKSGKGG